MKVEERKIDELNSELTVKISAEDYAECEKKKLSDCKRKAEFKGFRKGMAPIALIKRVYGDQCLLEAVNESISDALEGFIKDNKLNVLGEPMASENQKEVEWKSGNDFEFLFDLAKSPVVKLEVEKSDEVPSYTVTVAAKEKSDMVANYKKFYSEKKEGEENKEVKSDEEIEKEVSERLASQYEQEAKWRLTKDIRDYFVKKAGITIPEAFLKRWLVYANEGKVTKEQVEKEFPAFAEDFKWQLVRGYLMEKFGFKVEQKDIEEAAKNFIKYQYAMYGLDNVPEEQINTSVAGILSDRKQVERLIEQVEDEKVISRIKEEITIKSKKIGSEKFRAL